MNLFLCATKMNPFLIAGIIILCVIVAFFIITTIFGITTFFITLNRGALIGKRINKRFHKRTERYAIDYSWFDDKRQEKIIIENEGLKLCGFLIRTEKFTNKVAILNHGYFQNHLDMQPYAKMFLDLGYNVLLLDARAHGESEGGVIGLGWLDRKDLQKWIDTTIEIFGKESKIVLFGVSMGASTVCMTSGEQLPKNVKCIISDTAYDSAYTQFAYVLKRRTLLGEFPVITITNKFAKAIGKYSLRDASTIKQVAKSKFPILFIHGSKDTFVPSYMSNNLYHTLKPEQREIFIVDKAEHIRSYAKNKEEYTHVVSEWTNKWVK